MSLRARLHAWLDHVAPTDPSWAPPSHGSNSACACTYPTSAQVDEALTVATRTDTGTRLLLPWEVAKATRAVMDLIDRGTVRGEVGDIDSLRRARLSADERRNDGRVA